MLVSTGRQKYHWGDGYGSAFAVYRMEPEEARPVGWAQIVDGQWRLYGDRDQLTKNL
ncbi:hypothetical protein [Thermosulfurimonas sp. F29]|uniref:hypothetical protein n=1 Tax=Thermosulfurimonas sp. F29 TaxID=2867247 RepID=UPI001C831D78|nr:hypothetical protein [Thermosulfurimonas sp. F29]MBX6423415.1 hypothetical protein [Thermosulfurimonas sp. F29]